ncbi:hypothetical protein HZU77_010890 [Neisseriaceae bacterium TC5R-5]|nr:hypothetical protein [Neisseriaceae bacterium TC5R-5]
MIKRHQGMILLLVLPLLAMLVISVMGSSRSIVAEQRISHNVQERQKVRLLAEQALGSAEQAVWQLDKQLAASFAAEKYPDAATWLQMVCHGDNTELCRQAKRLWLWPGNGSQNTLASLTPCGQSQELAFFTLSTRSSCQGLNSRTDTVWSNPHYLVELIDLQFLHPWLAEPGRLYRVSVRAWGKNPRSVVTLQSWFLVGNPQFKLSNAHGWRLAGREIANETG